MTGRHARIIHRFADGTIARLTRDGVQEEVCRVLMGRGIKPECYEVVHGVTPRPE